jgi:hypothetical protein
MIRLPSLVVALLLILTVLSLAIFVAHPIFAEVDHNPAAAKVTAWPRYEVTGKLTYNETLILFGGAPKQMWIEDQHTLYYLGFACEADHVQAQKLIGQLVEAEGYMVGRGYETWFVPVVLRERVKAKEGDR